VETARLPGGRAGGGVKFCGRTRAGAFWDTIRDLGGGPGPGGGGGTTLRRAGEAVSTDGDSLAEAALGRAGGRGGAGGGDGVEAMPSPPGVLLRGGRGAVREGADDTGLAGGGGGGALPGVIDVPDPLRAGNTGGAGTLRAGRAGTAVGGAEVTCD
jgi:hypothetical protein